MPELGLGDIVATAAIWLLWIAVIVLIGRGILSVIRDRRRDPAMDALRTRLANGDIDETEYERLRTTLQRQ